MADALVFDMPMELGLKLVTVIGSDFADAEEESFDDIIYESNGAGLGMALIDFEGPDAGGIVDGGILVALDGLLVFVFECQKLNINLNLMPRNLFLVTLGVDFAKPGSPWQTTCPIAFNDALDPGARDFDVMIAEEIGLPPLRGPG